MDEGSEDSEYSTSPGKHNHHPCCDQSFLQKFECFFAGKSYTDADLAPHFEDYPLSGGVPAGRFVCGGCRDTIRECSWKSFFEHVFLRFHSAKTGYGGSCGEYLLQQLVDIGLLREEEKECICLELNKRSQIDQAIFLQHVGGGVGN